MADVCREVGGYEGMNRYVGGARWYEAWMWVEHGGVNRDVGRAWEGVKHGYGRGMGCSRDVSGV